jgi:hypothetical protein
MNEMISINKFKGVVEFKMRIINFSLKFVTMAKTMTTKTTDRRIRKILNKCVLKMRK